MIYTNPTQSPQIFNCRQSHSVLSLLNFSIFNWRKISAENDITTV